ncbi:hypothetical protein IQ249_12205 [Lusitaniella coriacea LEGE 07157]|uniref:Uncharacterized protein n=1 Tax=Lusitaniella coriacea LEGE 07157 TaxID=945747 RepID=A0A8J7DWV3_9CYAN|nr:hypothetical protein [Lusitaniella coriacea]MBE9116664.1 hypothetical protein [Lusitaniella coriacea LEGE 07157]
MSKVTIVVRDEALMLAKVSAFKEAIAKNPLSGLQDSVEVVAVKQLSEVPQGEERFWCPLTLDLPPTLQFPGRAAFEACRDAEGLRQWVHQTLSYETKDKRATNRYFLPIVLTAKGPLYAEVIGQHNDNQYQQPVDLVDNQRQPLYYLGHALLDRVSATPGVYILEFELKGKEIIFCQLFPFPIDAAIASLGIQDPDLFTCHWLCLTDQAILDLTILDSGEWRCVETDASV